MSGAFLVGIITGGLFGGSVGALIAGLCTWKALEFLRRRHARERQDAEVRQAGLRDSTSGRRFGESSLPEGWSVAAGRRVV